MKKYIYSFFLLAALSWNQHCNGGTPPPCIEHGPYTNGPTASCGSLADLGMIGPTSFCVNEGDSVPLPALITAPTFNNGTITTIITYDCSSGSSSVSPISYSPGGLQFNPPPPSSSTPGTYSSDCFLVATPSDTNDCAPITVDYGNVSWNIVDTNAMSPIVIKPADTLKAITQAISMIQTASQAAGCSGTNMTFQGEIDCSWQYVCCDSTTGPYKKSSVTGSIKVGLPSLTCPIPGASVPIPYPVSKYAQLGLTFTLNGSGNASASLGVAQPCQQQPICVNVGATVSGTLALSGKVSAPYGWATCSASAGGSASCTVQTSGQDSQGNCSIAANLGACNLNWSASFSSVGICKPFSGSINMWTGYSITNKTDCMCF